MNRALLMAVAGLGLVYTGSARADIAPPLPPNKDAVAVTVEVDIKAKGPRLVVPNGVFTPPRVRPGPKGEPKSEAPTDGPNSRWLVVGVCLSMSLAFGGLWMIRRNGRGSMTGLSLLLAAGATVVAGTLVMGNAAPMPPFRPKKIENHPVAFEAKAEVDFVYGQEPVRLILDPESYEKLKTGKLKLPKSE